MVEEVAALSIRLEASTARFRQQIDRAERQLSRSARSMEGRVGSLNRRLEGFGARFGASIPTGAAAATAAVVALGAAIRSAARNGDALRALEGRFKALTDSAERAGNLTRGVLDISTETGAAVDSVGALVSRFLIASKEIGATDAATLKFTQTLVQLGQIGGASANEIANGTTQLSQALAGGIVRAEEFNSIIENTPLIAKAIADALGLSIGKLREMVLAGELTSRAVFDAILGKAGETQKKFNELPPSLERATGRMAAAWTTFSAKIDESIGFSRTLAGVIESLADKMDAVGVAAERNTPKISAMMQAQAGIANPGRGLDRRGDATAPIDFGDSKQIGLPPGAQYTGALAPKVRPFQGPPAPTEAEFMRTFAPGENDPRPKAKPVKPIDYGYNPSSGGSSGGFEDEAARILDSFADRVAGMDEDRLKLGLTSEALAKVEASFAAARVEQELLTAAAKSGAQVTDAQRQEIAALADQMVAIAVATDQHREAIAAKAEADKDAENAAKAHAAAIETIGNQISGAVIAADSFEGALKNVAVALANMAAQAALGAGPLGGLVNSLLGVAQGGLAGYFGSTSTLNPTAPGGISFTPQTPFAKGAAFSGGRVTPFATGGIVNSPTMFPMANGAGLMGEAGPEAIMPLKRIGGKLGVVAQGGGGQTINIDARGSTDPAATEAAVRRAVGEALARVPGVTKEQRRRGQL